MSEELLQNFKQIVIEVHCITDNELNTSYTNKIKCLEKLSKTHYIVHAHGNNHGKVVNNFPYVIELTYVNKKYFEYTPDVNKTALPTPGLDFSNNNSDKDLDLNFYPFVHTKPSPKPIKKVNNFKKYKKLNFKMMFQ